MYCGNLGSCFTSGFYIVALRRYEVSVSLPKEYFPRDSKRYWHDDNYCCTFYTFSTDFRWAELSGRWVVSLNANQSFFKQVHLRQIASLHLEIVVVVEEQHVCVLFSQWFSLKSW